MPRTIAALYDSRAEAEIARARLASELKAKAPRIIARDTAGAIDSLDIAPADADTYREGVRRGSFLVVSQVPSGASTKQIIEVLERAAGSDPGHSDEQSWGDPDQGVQVKLPDDAATEARAADRSAAPAEPRAEWPPHPRAADEQPRAAEQQSLDADEKSPLRAEAPSQLVDEAHVPVVEEELRVGKRQVARGGSRVHSFVQESSAEEQVSLREESIGIESRPSDRILSDSDLEEGGLFKERVFEIAQMREEPVVTKVAVVREEVIVRRTVRERTETVRDTVRRTEVEVEDLPPAAAKDDSPRTFFKGSPR